MVGPGIPENPLDQAYLSSMSQSPLYQAGIRLSRNQPQQPQPAAASPNRSLNFIEIQNFLRRFRIKNITYETLKNFPLHILQPAERAYVRYLQRNPDVFYRLASMDKQPQTLSVQDLQIASRLAGGAVVLNTEELRNLRSNPQQQPLPVYTAQPERAVRDNLEASETRQRHFEAPAIIRFLNQVNPNGVRFDELRRLSADAWDPDSEEAQILRFLHSRPVQKILYNLTLPYNGMLTPEMIRVLTSLIWNPMIYGAVPLIFLKSPVFDDEEDEQTGSVGPVEMAIPGRTNRKPVNEARRKIKMHAASVMALLHQINPEGGEVTLDQLQQYQPQNPKEAKLLKMLKRSRVFRSLAGRDHHPDSLSEDDIRLAVSEDYVILSDPYMMLVLVP